MNKLLTQNIWPRLTAQARKSNQCFIAVAYLGNGATKLLPLKSGSRLVVDLSENAVKSGQTSPHEILKFIARGVNVSSVGNLHAKVFVLGKHAFIGSANASTHSANTLIEAMIETTNKSTVIACRRFVDSMSGEVITPEYAMRMVKLYRPPRIVFRPSTAKHSVPSHPPLWAIPLGFTEWDSEDKRQEKIGVRVAKQKLRDVKKFEIRTFQWEGLLLKDRLKCGDKLIEATTEKRGRLMIAPPATVLLVRKYKKEGKLFSLIHVEARKGVKQKHIRFVLKQVGNKANQLKKLRGAKLLRNAKLVHALFQLWPK